MASVLKLRNATEGGFVLQVPFAKDETSSVHVIIASNAVVPGTQVPFEVRLFCGTRAGIEDKGEDDGK